MRTRNFIGIGLALTMVAMIARGQSPEPEEAELKLEYLPTTAPGLVGYLGDPALGYEFLDAEVVWHPSGRLFASRKGYSFLRIWTNPTASQPAKCLGTLNAEAPFALSGKGDLLCAKATPVSELLGRTPNWSDTSSVSCFRFADGKAQWTFTAEKLHRIDGVCFNSEGTRVLVASFHSQQRTLRLLDAASGQELEHLVLPGVESGSMNGARNLLAWGQEFVALRHPKDGENKLLRVQLNPLRAEVIPYQSEYYTSRLHLSRDGRWLVVYGQDGYEVLEQRDQRWNAAISGNANMTDDSLETVAISPDSRLLYVASQQQGRVIDLNAGKVIKELDDGAWGADFAPDGSAIALAEHSGLTRLETKTWTTPDAPADRHDCPVEMLLPLPDNKTLISRDHNALIVWDLPSRKPRAMLKSKRTMVQVGDAVLANNNREIIAPDGWDFLRWRLPELNSPPPAQSAVIQGELAFGGVPRSGETCAYMAIQGDSSGRRFATVMGLNLQLRDLAQPGVVKTFAAAKTISDLPFDPMFFTDDQTLSIFETDKGMQQLDLTTDQLRVAAPKPENGSFGLWIPAKRAVVWTRGDGLSFVEASTGKTLLTLDKPAKKIEFGGITQCAVTPDGKWVAAIMRDSSKSLATFVTIWDAESSQLLALQPAHNFGFSSLALTPDGRTLVAGHDNAAISIWDVAALVKAGVMMPEELPATANKPSTSTGTSTPKRSLIVLHEEPEKPLKDRNGHDWSFQPDGSLMVEGRLPSFGVMKINGKPLTTKKMDFMRVQDQDILQPGMYLNREMTVEGEELCVSRHLGLSSSLDGGGMGAVEAFTNTSAQAMNVQIEFTIQFPADAGGLLTTGGRRVPMGADGQFTLSAEDQWLAPAGSGKPRETLAVIRANTWSNSTPPLRKWDSASKTLHFSYEATIPPGATRWLIHSATLLKREAEGALDILAFPQRTDLGYYVLPGTQGEGINFGKADETLAEGLWDALPLMVRQQPVPEIDALGFRWELRHDLGRTGALGATAVHALWLDGRPPAFQAAQLVRLRWLNGEHRQPPFVSLRSAESMIFVSRQSNAAEGGGSTVWLDTYNNPAKEAQRTRASYLTTFRAPVVAVWDVHGKKHDFAALKESTAELGGACAFVLQGEQQPATLLAFHKDGAPLMPTLRRISDRSVALDFAIEMEPQTSFGLLLGACQRPLAAFGNAQEAFRDWLPLTAPTKQAFVYRMKPKAPNEPPGQPPLPVLNYATTVDSGQ